MKSKKREASEDDSCGTIENWKIVMTSLVSSPLKKEKQGSYNLSTIRSLCRRRLTKNDCSWEGVDGSPSDASGDLRLAFPSIEATPSDHEVSALSTLLSPIFHLFGQDGANSSSGNEVSDDVSEKLDDAQSKPEAEEASQKNNDRCMDSSPDCEGRQSVDQSYVVGDLCSEKKKSDIVDDVLFATNVNPVIYISGGANEEVLEAQTVFDLSDLGASYMEWTPAAENRDHLHTVDHLEDEFLNSDGASLYLAVQQSRVLDVNPVITHIEADDDLDGFDPYLFIKQLPDLSEVASLVRPPIVLPKQMAGCPPITLVLDLDETLVHSSLECSKDADFSFPLTLNSQEYTVYVRCRPHLHTFMERVAQLFEIIVFTASQSSYAEKLLDILDPAGKLIQHRVFRDSCIFIDGNYLKDLTILGRDLSKVAIVDNSPQAFGFQVDNGIPVESWFSDKSDTALTMLLPFLESLVGVDDVRPIIAEKFHTHQKIVQTTHPLLT